MSAESTPDMEWATKKLESKRLGSHYWQHFLTEAGENISGLHGTVALILIAKGIEKRPVEKVIEKLKKEGLADGAGIDSARNS